MEQEVLDPPDSNFDSNFVVGFLTDHARATRGHQKRDEKN